MTPNVMVGVERALPPAGGAFLATVDVELVTVDVELRGDEELV